jgi:two-component system chemotaxis sensor kinase CheA
MDTADSEFLKRIQATYRIEAEEHLRAFSSGLMELEKTQTKESHAGIIEAMFREIHSLKGASRSVDQKEMESVCHPLENLFSALKRMEITLRPASFDLLHKTVEFLSRLIADSGKKQSPADLQNKRDLIQQLVLTISEAKNTPPGEEQVRQTDIATNVSPADIPLRTSTPPEPARELKLARAEVVKIPISKLDPLLFQAEEFLQTKISLRHQTNNLIDIVSEVNEWKAESVRRRGRHSMSVDAQWNEWEESDASHLNKLESHLSAMLHALEKNHHNLERIANDHLDAVKQLLMLPVAFLVEAFPAMVREISRNQEKEIELMIQGSNLEIDKRILEEIKDPLIHLIRNCIDHGIGTPRERLQHNKPSLGKITMTFSVRESGLVEITVSDDGKGIDKTRVLASAVKSGSISEEVAEKLNTDEILSLIFLSGLSTSPIITNLSGRGLGLSIVREKVERLNGSISVETLEKEGTTFRIILPLTLATFRGILVGTGDQRFILPIMNVERVIRVKAEDFTTLENHETMRIDNDILPVVSLQEALGLPERRAVVTRSSLAEQGGPPLIRIVVLVSGQKRIAIKVDEVFDENQVLVKGLGKLLRRVRNISGATILGSGTVVPVINVADLMTSAIQAGGRKTASDSETIPETKSAKILVAEDSITSRTLLKNILETAGYLVTVAIDGSEAWARIKRGAFDLVLSDVDMPKMNGFELTKKIRNDAGLSKIPVVLITSLESREDFERGIEAGADAYMIKNSFDQGNLLELIRKLI